jgi:hypothetical protein
VREWTKRENIHPAAALAYSEIWDGAGWQINKSTGDEVMPFVLIDATMPHDMPASPIMGRFASLEEAQAKAAEFGPPDWEPAA